MKKGTTDLLLVLPPLDLVLLKTLHALEERACLALVLGHDDGPLLEVRLLLLGPHRLDLARERQVLLDLARDLERVEVPGRSLDGLVGRVDLQGRLEAFVPTDLAEQTHTLPGTLVGEQERGDGVVKLSRLDRQPGSKEDDV